jgi:hypothetical protein
MPRVSLIFGQDIKAHIVLKSGSIVPVSKNTLAQFQGKKFDGQSSYGGSHAKEIKEKLGYQILFLTPEEYLGQFEGAVKKHEFVSLVECVVFSCPQHE